MGTTETLTATDTTAAEPAETELPGRARRRSVRARSPRTWWVRVRPVATGDTGMATAEYAIATVAAAGFAGLLLLILRSDEVRGALLAIVRGALSV